MNTIHYNDTVQLPPCVATIGFFDGVHRGHQFLIHHLVETARKDGLQSTVITFDAHPRKVLQADYQPEMLSTLDSKLLLLSKTEVDNAVVLHFDKAMAAMSARADYYAIVDQKNPKRILHALEICYMTGKPYSSFRTNKKKERSFDIIKIGLRRDREELYERINKRVDEMIQNGLIDEVKNVMSYRYTNALNTVGYKEIFQYLDGNWSLEQAIEKIKQNTRIYSRKQMTWYKKDTEIHWFHPDNDKEIKKFLELVLND